MTDTTTYVLILDGPFDGREFPLDDQDPGVGDQFFYRGRRMRYSELHSSREGRPVYLDVSP